MNQYIEILISVAMVIFIFYNQVRVRQVKSDTSMIIPGIMLVLGVINFKNYMNSNQLTLISWITIISSFSLLAIGMAAIRANTVRIWQSNKIVYRQGTWITVVLWIVSIALHLILNQIGHVGQSTSLIYFAITFTVQKIIVKKRATKV